LPNPWLRCRCSQPCARYSSTAATAPGGSSEKPKARMAGLRASGGRAVISWPGDVVRRGGLTRCLPSLSHPLIIDTTDRKLDRMWVGACGRRSAPGEGGTRLADYVD
jgi:hypothetical protein